MRNRNQYFGRLPALLAAMALCMALAAGGLVLSAGSVLAQGFVDGFEDLPLAPRLSSMPEAKVAFDTSEGRIVVSFARTVTSRQAVLSFYADALPQLGWKTLSPQRFGREGEVLSIDFVTDGEDLIVRFSLSPN
jgi:hypothetical protein